MDEQVNHYSTGPRPVRLIAVGNHISLKAALSEESFAAELECIVSLAVPHLSRERPNLLALGEMLGLPLALAGKRGYLARRMHTSSSEYAHLRFPFSDGRIKKVPPVSGAV